MLAQVTIRKSKLKERYANSFSTPPSWSQRKARTSLLNPSQNPVWQALYQDASEEPQLKSKNTYACTKTKSLQQIIPWRNSMSNYLLRSKQEEHKVSVLSMGGTVVQLLQMHFFLATHKGWQVRLEGKWKTFLPKEGKSPRRGGPKCILQTEYEARDTEVVSHSLAK